MTIKDYGNKNIMTILKLWQLEIGVCFFGSVCHAFMTGVRALTRTWPRCSWRHSTTKWWWWLVSSMLWWAGNKQTIILLSKYIFHLSRLAIQSYNFWTPSTDAGTKLISFSFNTYYDGLLFFRSGIHLIPQCRNKLMIPMNKIKSVVICARQFLAIHESGGVNWPEHRVLTVIQNIRI